MTLTTTQLNIIHILGKGISNPIEIAKAIKKSKSQVYRAIEGLEKESLVELNKKKLQLKPTTHANLLTKLLVDNPNLIHLLSDSAIKILLELIEPSTINLVATKLNMNKAGIYRWIKKFQKVSVVRRKDSKYYFNEMLWSELKEFLIVYQKFNEHIDSRVPLRATIYYKDEKEILFSSKAGEKGTLTAFSRYKDYGITILTTKNYYRLPEKKVSLKHVFIDSLQIAEKEKESRNLIFIALFYMKHKSRLSVVKHTILNNIKEVLKGKEIEGYPTLRDIKDRAEMYDTRI
jgi:predicted transcriptional regulator